MKQLTCEMCGSTDLVKEEGFVVCQSCGMKYSVEEAKKMMVEIEGTVEVKGTVKIDIADEIENLLIRAEEFEKENKTQKALEYYNKVLDIDATHEYAKERIIYLSDRYIGSVKVSTDVILKIDRYMENKQKLEAIKFVRETTGLGLAEAKKWVENYKTYNILKPQEHLQPPSESQSGCYVATCVYGSYDCPQVWTLRRFRDDTLGSTWYGRLFIRAYYAVSPTLVKWFGKTNWFKKLWRGKLDRMVAKLQSNGVEDTPYQDKEW